MQRENKDIGRILEFMRPGVSRNGVVTVEADGVINLNWDEGKLGPKPTDAELDKAWLDLLKREKEIELAEQSQKEIFNTFPEARGNNIMLTFLINTTPGGDGRMTTMRNLRSKLDSKVSEVRSATTPAQVSGVRW